MASAWLEKTRYPAYKQSDYDLTIRGQVHEHSAIECLDSNPGIYLFIL